MKTIIKFALASLIAATALGASNTAEAKSFWKYNVQFMKDGLKSYSKNCINNGSYCGNWNVTG